jgi:polyferredoxin
MSRAAPQMKPQKAFFISRSRKTIQWLGVFATVLIGIRHILPGESSGGSFDSFCPFGGVETFLPYLLSGETLKTTSLLNFSILLGVLGVALVAGRAFCGWMCPLGTLQDFFATWARRLSGEKKHIRGKKSPAFFPLRVPTRLDKTLRNFKYLVLALILMGSLFTIYPPTHAFCPVRAFFAFNMTPLLWGVLIIFVAGAVLVERAWCKYMCPLGALLAIFNRFAPVRLVAESSCNHCGRCDIECSMGIQDVPDNLGHTECIRCMECLDTCARKDSLTLKVGR